MDSRRLEPGIREEMRAGTENTTGQNREDRIRGRGVRMETGSVFGKKISGRYMFGGYHSRSQLTRDCGGLEFWIINGDLAFWYMGSSIRNGLSEWKIMEQWVKTIQGRGDYGHTTVVWVVLLRGEQNGLRWFGLVNWCGRRKYEMLGIWSQVLVSLNHELDRMQIKYARYYVWCYARVSIWYLETADGSCVPKLAVRTQPPSSPLSLPLVVKSQFAVCANDPNLRSTLFTGCQYGNIGSRNLCLNSTIPFFSTSVKHIQRVVARHLGTQRSLCMVKSLKFSSLKVFSENSTLIRVIFGNIQSKEIIGTVSDIRSISSGFATIVFSRFLRSENLFALAKQALEAFFFFVLNSLGLGYRFGPLLLFLF
ncbi:unnamed protein product [Brassica oleracea]|uniref:(rape) hypothetical protein n=1 Tax=Brassica napus TaxID=3708 RepID=A0A816IST5_BRANA|nr:unnamed protein product [Brassica napus]